MKECTFKPQIVQIGQEESREFILEENHSKSKEMLPLDQMTPIDMKFQTESSFNDNTLLKNSNPEIKEILYLFSHIQNSLKSNSIDLKAGNSMEKANKGKSLKNRKMRRNPETGEL